MDGVGGQAPLGGAPVTGGTAETGPDAGSEAPDAGVAGRGSSGGGCTQSPRPSAPWALLLALPVALLRRRGARRR
jgi:hypothetical protein